MFKVDLCTDLRSPSGYSRHAREVIKAIKGEVDLRLINHRHDQVTVSLPDDVEREYVEMEAKTRTPDVRIQFETPEFFQPAEGVLNVGFTQWETTRIPDTDLDGNAAMNWVKQMNRMDLMWTSSQMTVEAFAKSGVETPCDIVRGPMDTSAFMPGLPELELDRIVVNNDDVVPKHQRPMVFAQTAQWTMRKDIESFLLVLLSRFSKADSRILLKTYGSVLGNTAENDGVRSRIQNLRGMVKNDDAPGITLIDGKLTDKQIAQLYSSVDFYVNTSRGEGFCMPLVEAMASECFVVSSAFSAPADYIESPGFEGVTTPEQVVDLLIRYQDRVNGLLVKYTLKPAVGMAWNPWYRHSQDWGQIDCQDLELKLKAAVMLKQQHPDVFKKICKNARKTVVDTMSSEATAKQILDSLEVRHREFHTLTPGAAG